MSGVRVCCVQRPFPQLSRAIVSLGAGQTGGRCCAGHRVLLTALLRNLVLNAAATEPNDETVTVRCERCPDGIRLSVEDQGR